MISVSYLKFELVIGQIGIDFYFLGVCLQKAAANGLARLITNFKLILIS
jgi:hypothetical protein